mgnify:FL=1|tara:strand:+ start:1277 stop:1690 length:414 start_codon:yes stop_codon:yes gene_type:complete
MPSYRFRAEKYVSRGFKDLAVSFNENPSTKDFGAVKNERAISQSVRNLLLTTFGERPFQPEIGSRVKGLLFEQWDVFAADAIRTEIFNVMERLEPRIEVTEVKVDDASDENAIEISMDYVIVGQELVQNVEFLLEKT